mgnify:CR=1 FL=1
MYSCCLSFVSLLAKPLLFDAALHIGSELATPPVVDLPDRIAIALQLHRGLFVVVVGGLMSGNVAGRPDSAVNVAKRRRISVDLSRVCSRLPIGKESNGACHEPR